MARISSRQKVSERVLFAQKRRTLFFALPFRKCLSTLRNGVMPTPPAIMTISGFPSMPRQKTPRGPATFTESPGMRPGMDEVKAPSFLMEKRRRASSGAAEMVNGCGSLQPSGPASRMEANCPAFRAASFPSVPSR